jgi:predicted transcriptional regulator of viral defense system
MDKKTQRHLTLKQYLNRLQAEGQHWFIFHELEQHVSLKQASLRVALSRLAQSGQIKMIRRGFGIIQAIPGQEPHPTYYIDAMMNHLGSPYYVGLLSAAAYWGASHQANMNYQVITDRVISPVRLSANHIEFVTKKSPLPSQWIRKEAGVGGYFSISSPELTAIDIVKFQKRCGHLNNVATVLSSLAHKWDGRTMFSICHDPYTSTTTLQRLGYILDEVLELKKEATIVERALKRRAPTAQILSVTKKANRKINPLNKRWSLYINTILEPD